MSSSQRLKRVFVSEHLLLELFSPLGQCVALRLNHPKLPKDAKVVRVNDDWSRQALSVLVQSDEFPETPCGLEVPLFDEAPVEFQARYIDRETLTQWKPASVAISEILAAQYASLPPPGFSSGMAMGIPPELLEGESTLANTAETEAEFFRKSIMAE